jgi:hypothetical protein
VKRPNVVEVANEKVAIVVVCRMLGVQLPDDLVAGRSQKVHCPFGEIYHSDGGLSPAMRIYPDTNSAYCFSCAAYYTPVSLAAKAMDTTYHTAAIRLLDHIGHRPMDLAQQWQQVAQFEPEPDRALLADALKTYCRRIEPQWSQRQFEEGVARVLTRCLGLLDLVKSAGDVTLWLDRCKEAMRRAMHREELSLSQKYDVLWRDNDQDEEGPRE